jgi:hypothetical protein
MASVRDDAEGRALWTPLKGQAPRRISAKRLMQPLRAIRANRFAEIFHGGAATASCY